MPGLRRLHRAGGSSVDLADGFEDERGGAADGATDQVAGAVAVVDLGQPVVHLDGLAVGAGGHITEGQRVGQRLRGRGELAGQDVGEAALFASMMMAQEWCVTRRLSMGSAWWTSQR